MAYYTSGNARRKQAGGAFQRTPKPLTQNGDRTTGGAPAPPSSGLIWPRKAK